MNKIVQPQWLEWAKELQFIAQGGLTYSKDVFDIERFERIREIAAEMLSLQSEIPIEKVKNLFVLTPGGRTSFYCIKKLPHFLHGRRELLNKL